MSGKSTCLDQSRCGNGLRYVPHRSSGLSRLDYCHLWGYMVGLRWPGSGQSEHALPVLQHGPRSLTRAQALVCQTHIGRTERETWAKDDNDNSTPHTAERGTVTPDRKPAHKPAPNPHRNQFRDSYTTNTKSRTQTNIEICTCTSLHFKILVTPGNDNLNEYDRLQPPIGVEVQQANGVCFSGHNNEHWCGCKSGHVWFGRWAGGAPVASGKPPGTCPRGCGGASPSPAQGWGSGQTHSRRACDLNGPTVVLTMVAPPTNAPTTAAPTDATIT
eukprot:gene7931-biopygen9115